MDMQPITSAMEKAFENNIHHSKRHSSSIQRGKSVSKTIRRGNSPLTNTSPVAVSDEEGPPLLMMASMNSHSSCENDHYFDGADHSSPSKCLLLTNQDSCSNVSSHSSSKNRKLGVLKVKMHTNWSVNKKSNSKGVGMSSKISRALFRDRRSSNFSKMDQVTSDAFGSHFKKHFSKGNAEEVSPILSAAPSDEQDSFDNSNTSDAEEPTTKQQVKQPKRNESFTDLVNYEKSTGYYNMVEEEKDEGVPMELKRGQNQGNVSILTMDSEFNSLAMRQKTSDPDTQTAPILSRAPPSTTSATSSLNYSVSQASSDPTRVSRMQMSGNSIKTDSNESVKEAPVTATESIIEDLDSSMSAIMQERLLERLNLAAGESKKIKAMAIINGGAKRSEDVTLTTTKNQVNTSTAASCGADSDVQEKIRSPVLPPKAPRKVMPALMKHQQDILFLKEKQERLLQEGDFLNESASQAGSEATTGDIAQKLLNRLEAAVDDDMLMAEHHHQDPPLTMTMTNSFASSAAGTSASMAKLRSSSAVSVVTLHNNDPYASFLEQASITGHEGNLSVSTGKYHYSQDQEFENSILSPGSVNITNPKLVNESTASKLLPESPKNLYKSDAIQTSPDGGNGVEETKTNEFGESVPPTAEDANSVSENDDKQTRGGPKIVSDEFLNMVTSGCTGPVNKEVIAEKLVALEAGWTGLKTSVNDRIQGLEESWRNWDVKSFLKGSPKKDKAASDAAGDSEERPSEERTAAKAESIFSDASATAETASVPDATADKIELKAASSSDEPPFVQAFECTLGEDDPANRNKSGENSQDSFVKELERSRSAKFALEENNRIMDKYRPPCLDMGVEKIGIETTEHEVPLSLKNSLAEISMIGGGDDVNNSNSSSNPSHSASSTTHLLKSANMINPCLDSSREDSEGGKIILDATEWDPVSPDEMDAFKDLSNDPLKEDGFFYKHKSGGKVLRSPTSVLVEI